MSVVMRHWREDGLTGRTRIRAQRLMLKPDVIVVQVEMHGVWIEDSLSGMSDITHMNRWRDALISDFQVTAIPEVRRG